MIKNLCLSLLCMAYLVGCVTGYPDIWRQEIAVEKVPQNVLDGFDASFSNGRIKRVLETHRNDKVANYLIEYNIDDFESMLVVISPKGKIIMPPTADYQFIPITR